MGVLRPFVELTCFAAELGMLALLAVSGWSLGDGGLLGIALAVLYPALAIVLWGLYLARTAERRLADPWRLMLQLVLFGATTAAAVGAGHTTLGIIFAVVAVVAFGLIRVLGESPTHARPGTAG